MIPHKFKIILLGDGNVGKTCFLMRYVHNTFTQNHLATIGVDVRTKNIQTVNGEEVTLQIWDTAGQEKFRSLSPSYIRSADGVLLLYDITSKRSFENMVTWLEEVEKNSKQNKEVMIVGNKCDCESLRQVSYEEGDNLSKESAYCFIEASAKDGKNIDDCFIRLVEEMIKKPHDNKDNINNTKGIRLSKTDKVKKQLDKCKCK